MHAAGAAHQRCNIGSAGRGELPACTHEPHTSQTRQCLQYCHMPHHAVLCFAVWSCITDHPLVHNCVMSHPVRQAAVATPMQVTFLLPRSCLNPSSVLSRSASSAPTPAP